LIARRSQAPFASVANPWRASVDTRSPWPARFYAGLIGQALRYGMPSRRRPGRLWALAGRRGVPEGALAAALRRFPRRPRPDIEALLARVRSGWPAMAEASARIPCEPPEPLTALGIERSAGLTVFVFGGEPAPLLVLKLGEVSEQRLRVETSALREAAPAGIAPRALGMVGAAHAQEALPGAPLRVEPLAAGAAAALRWPRSLASLAAGIAGLSQATTKRQPADDLAWLIEPALREAGLSAGTRRSLAAAWREVRGVAVSVLRHRDTSPQNCLFEGDRLTGIVDWEISMSHGSPGFDVWNAALAWMEHGLGLRRWSEEEAVEALRAAWGTSRFWSDARAAARTAATAGGMPEQHLDALEILFFGARVGLRVVRPGAALGPGLRASAAMLDVVCAG